MYVPHLWLVRRLGLRTGAFAARVSSLLHWLLTWCGAQRAARRNLNRLQHQLREAPSTSQILRRLLANKHQCFVESQLSATAAGRASLSKTVVIKNQKALERLSLDGGILLVHHFGCYQAALVHLADQGLDIQRVRLISRNYQDAATPWAAELALQVKQRHAADCGVGSILLGEGSVMDELCARLAEGRLVSIAADGLQASRTVELPFLGCQMNFSTGWAYLAAKTNKPVVPMFAFVDGTGQRRLEFHDPIFCRSTSAADIHDLVAEAIALLEERVRDQPWDWHLWQRLQLSRAGAAANHRLAAQSMAQGST